MKLKKLIVGILCVAIVLTAAIPVFAAEPVTPYATPTSARYIMTGVGSQPRMYLNGSDTSASLGRSANCKWRVMSYHGIAELYKCSVNGNPSKRVLQTTGLHTVSVGPETTSANQAAIEFFTVGGRNNRIVFSQHYHMVNGAKWYDRCLQGYVGGGGSLNLGSYAENALAQMWEVQ